MKSASADRLPLHWRWAFAGGQYLARRSPLVQRMAATLLAVLLRLFARRRRAIIAANIALCFPERSEAEQRRLVAANLRSMALGVVDTLVAWFGDSPAIDARVDVQGLDELRSALDAGRGALCLFAHFHSIELGGRALSQALGRPMHQMVRPHNLPAVEATIAAARRRFCDKAIEKQALAEFVRSLRQGHAVGYAPDQNFKRHIAFVPFFGQPAATLTTSARLARMTGAPLFCCWFVRNGDRFRLDIERLPSPSGDDERDTAHWMAALEARIRATPEQYLWAHRRFKSQPAGTAPAYPAHLLKVRDRR
jgi:KDO2-lipid IV(A) lauroyltransferase